MELEFKIKQKLVSVLKTFQVDVHVDTTVQRNAFHILIKCRITKYLSFANVCSEAFTLFNFSQNAGKYKNLNIPVPPRTYSFACHLSIIDIE